MSAFLQPDSDYIPDGDPDEEDPAPEGVLGDLGLPDGRGN
jgi:hypothetical protein